MNFFFDSKKQNRLFFNTENEAYPTVLEEDLKSSSSNKNYAQEKKNRDLISYFIRLDKSCHENDEVNFFLIFLKKLKLNLVFIYFIHDCFTKSSINKHESTKKKFY